MESQEHLIEDALLLRESVLRREAHIRPTSPLVFYAATEEPGEIVQGSGSSTSTASSNKNHRTIQSQYETLPTQQDDAQDNEHECTPCKAPLVLICIAFLITFGVMVSAVSGIDVIYLLICQRLSLESANCFQDTEVTKLASSYLFYQSLLMGVVTLFGSGFLSLLSDRVGRKPVLIALISLSAFGKTLEWYMVFGRETPVYYYYLLFPFCIGALGGIPSLGAVVIPYIADTVKDVSQRARILALAEGGQYLGLALAPSVGSFIIKTFGLSKVYLTASALLSLALLIAIFFMNETNCHTHKSKESTVLMDIGSALRQLQFKNVESGVQRRNAIVLFVCATLGLDFMVSTIDVIILVVKSRFNWSAIEIGYMITIFTSTKSFACVLAFPLAYQFLSRYFTPVSSAIDRLDVTFLRVMQFFLASGLVYMSLAESSRSFLLGCFINSLSGIGSPALKSALLKYVEPTNYGKFMAAYSFFTSLMLIFLPPLCLVLFQNTLQIWSGLTLAIIAGCVFTLLLLTILIKPLRSESTVDVA